jgi:hypothetical protein
LILIFSVNTNHESVAYRSFSPSKFEARGARKVTTGIEGPRPPHLSESFRLNDIYCKNSVSIRRVFE